MPNCEMIFSWYFWVVEEEVNLTIFTFDQMGAFAASRGWCISICLVYSSRCFMFSNSPFRSRMGTFIGPWGLLRLFHHRLSNKDLLSSQKRRRRCFHTPVSFHSLHFSLVGWWQWFGWIKSSLQRWSRKRKNAQRLNVANRNSTFWKSILISQSSTGDHAMSTQRELNSHS